MQMHCGTRLSRKFPNFVSLHCRHWAGQLGKDNTKTFNKTQTVIVSNICDTQPAYTHIVPQKRRPAGNFLVSSLSSFFFCKYLNLQVIFNPSPQSIMYCRVIIRSCTLSCRAPALCALCLGTVSNITHGFIDWS